MLGRLRCLSKKRSSAEHLGFKGARYSPIFPNPDPSFPMPPRAFLSSFPFSSPLSACHERSRTALRSHLRFLRCWLMAVDCQLASPKSSLSPASTRLVYNPFLSPTYAKTGGYPLFKNVGAPTFSIFPLIFYSFSHSTYGTWQESWLPSVVGTSKSHRYTAECGEKSGSPSFPRQAEVSAGPTWKMRSAS